MKNTLYIKSLLLLLMGFLLFNHQTQAQDIQDSSVENEVIVEGEIMTYVEQMPEFYGGNEQLYTYVVKNLKYPNLAKENKIEGTVYVGFVIPKEGKVTNVTQLGKAQGWGLDEEAIRLVKSMPDWRPAKQNGKPVNCKFTLPIKFKLN
jgi:protein TonB